MAIFDLSDDSESKIDDYIPSVFEDDDLSGIIKSTTKYLNYGNSYVPTWNEPKAFCETYQNWYDQAIVLLSITRKMLTQHRRDGILRSHRLSLSISLPSTPKRGASSMSKCLSLALKKYSASFASPTVGRASALEV